jgi:uncharacterized SAM-binding protein YcdF (DUF218 family)
VLKKKMLLWGLPLLLLMGAGTWWLAAGGSYLVKKDTPIPADAIVVLMGSLDDRIQEAIDLYRAGYGKKLIMVQETSSVIRGVKRTPIFVPSKAQRCRDAFIKAGIPDSNILILNDQAESTSDEAKAVQWYMEFHPQMDTILLVSSSFHTRRASMIFKNTLSQVNPAVTVLASPSKYTRFKTKGWWKDSWSRQQGVREYAKILDFYFHKN